MSNHPEDERGLYRLLGELSADMKHVLRALESNKATTKQLRDEMRVEHANLNERLTRVEKFNMKVLTYATVLVTIGAPIIISLIKWGIPAILAAL